MPHDARVIVHLVEPGGGGTLRHVMDLAEAQIAAGLSVHIVYSPLRLESPWRERLFALQGAALHPLSMRRAPHVSDLGNLFALVKLLRRLQPDVLHAHSTKAGLLARLARLFHHTRVVYTPHALMSLNPLMPRWQRALYGFYERMLSPWMDCMLVLSRHEAAEAQTLGIPPSKIRLIHNAIPPMRLADRDALRRAQKLTESDVVAGFVGRFSAQKNPQLAILAFAQAAQDCPTLHLWMIGDGPLRSDCENLATQLGIAHRVTWHGAVEAADFYAGMDMLLITSRYEGMAYTYLEALAAGLPILSTDVGGADSCVVEGQTGHILPTRAADFAEKMVLLCHDAPLRDAMHFAARGLSGRFLMGPDYCHQLLSVALR